MADQLPDQWHAEFVSTLITHEAGLTTAQKTDRIGRGLHRSRTVHHFGG